MLMAVTKAILRCSVHTLGAGLKKNGSMNIYLGSCCYSYSNNVTFGWSECEQICFDQVKTLIAADLLLAYYDVSMPVAIHCDASTDGLGATLLQEGRPVVSVSRTLSKSEKNYVAIELECLAIIHVFAC